MHLMRRVPGDPVSLEACIEAALGPADEHAATALSVREHINQVDPDMSMSTHQVSSVIRLTV